MILTRIGIVAIIGIIIVFEAAIVSVMNDNSKKMSNPTKSFHKWMIIWAAANTTIIILIAYIATGTILGWKI